jgi:hypothetical protein
MQWEFTPEDVVKARAGYRLEHFRRDLAEEIRRNLGGDDEQRHTRVFHMLYDMCHALATDKDFDDFLSAYSYDPPTCQFLREVRPAMADNVAMLGAVLQRMIMDGVEAGMPLDAAVKDAAARHASIVANALQPVTC